MRSLDPRNLESVRDAYDSAWVAAQQTSSHDRGLIRLLLAKCHLGLEQQLAETKKAEKLALTEESLAHAKASLQLLDKQSLDLRCLACYLKGICMAEKARFKRLSKGQRESCYKVAEAAFTEASRSQQCLPQVWQGRALVSYARYKNTRDRKHLDEVKNSLLEANKCRPGFGAYGLACVCSLLHECAWRRWIKTAMSCNMLLGPEELRKAADKGGDLEWARQQDPEWFEGFVTAVKEREQSASR